LYCLYKVNHTTRYAVFAGYNHDGTIPQYVIHYLKALDEVSDGIIYITDSPLKKGEEKKLKNINIIHSQFARHNEYDWGSYKRGYIWLRDNNYLKKTDELIFANDSCFAPLTTFKDMFNQMKENTNIDFWGNTQSTHKNPHLQSSSQ
jgi:lipopolysaccharide biosynthesis protein